MNTYTNRKWLSDKYNLEHLRMKDIADLCHVQYATIQRWMRKLKIKSRPVSERHMREWNGRWKGGRQFHKAFVNGAGYILVVINGKRYREHRIIMEKLLGRKLLKTEIVHHRDGNSINNNPKNLQLFNSISDHQRYEDALNIFAKQILFGSEKSDNHRKLLSLFNKLLSKNGQDIST